MRSIRCWNDLEEYGIIALTGEACGLSMRILCDVTTAGKKHLERFLGGNVEIRAGSNWNGGSGVDPHVGSVLLPMSIITDLGAFLLVMTGTLTVASLEGGTVREYDKALTDDDERFYHVKRYYRRSAAPGTGDRNEHAFSGRTK